MSAAQAIEPIALRHADVGGSLDDFDYVCSKARGDHIDRLVLAVFEDQGWSLSDDEALDRVTVQHAGPTRARVLVDGKPATAWWDDRVETVAGALVWHFEPVV